MMCCAVRRLIGGWIWCDGAANKPRKKLALKKRSDGPAAPAAAAAAAPAPASAPAPAAAAAAAAAPKAKKSSAFAHTHLHLHLQFAAFGMLCADVLMVGCLVFCADPFGEAKPRESNLAAKHQEDIYQEHKPTEEEREKLLRAEEARTLCSDRITIPLPLPLPLPRLTASPPPQRITAQHYTAQH
jgi:hypothetical protein